MKLEEIEHLLRTRPLLGKGAFSHVVDLGDGNVLKVCKARDGTGDYIEWCYERGQRFGLGSPEMLGFPQIIEFGMLEESMHGSVGRAGSFEEGFEQNAYYCVMRKLDAYTGDWYGSDILKQLRTLCDWLGDRVFYPSWANDLHQGNVMIDKARGCVVLTDPSCNTPWARWSREQPCGQPWVTYQEPEPVELSPFIGPGVGLDILKARVAGLGFDLTVDVCKAVGFMDALDKHFKQHLRVRNSDLIIMHDLYVPVKCPKQPRQAQWKVPQLRQQLHMQGV
jgi:hypothetical protein